MTEHQTRSGKEVRFPLAKWENIADHKALQTAAGSNAEMFLLVLGPAPWCSAVLLHGLSSAPRPNAAREMEPQTSEQS